MHWRLAVGSTLLYTLAFNITFFVQELFLVVPKALTPGLRPTLFHNNHTWQGHHPLASLFQGTGALATVISAVVCMLLLRGDRIRSRTARLFLVWMAFNGFFMALPQVVIGALVPANDVGMAMDYFHMSAGAKRIAAIIALLLLIPIGRSVAREMLRVMPLKLSLTAFAAIPLIVPFRVPRNALEVLLPTMLVAIVGLAAVLATAWSVKDATPVADDRPISIAYPLCAVSALLLVFQLLLRPGIAFC
ncbi:MAG TPA: hypothetical protein VJQ52_11310 [Steroidobacteraceae bacterium]|nr:hypothetical protein [Steroidobacteraceae bacterium]